MSFVNAPRRHSLVFALIACLAAALGGAVATAAPPTSPTKVVIESVTSDFDLPDGLPGSAVPRVIVKAGDTVHVKVNFYDASGAPASFSKDTKLTITSNVGTLTVGTGTALALKGETTKTIDTSLTTAVNQVVFTVSAGSGPKALTGKSYDPSSDDPDLRFDVLTDVSVVPLDGRNGNAFQAGFGGNDGCAEATEAAPVCEIVLLPRGSGSDVVLSVGACDPDLGYAPCFKGTKGVVGGAVLQALFAQPSTAYSVDAPATVVVKCDKLLCGGGAIRNLTVIYSLGGNDPLTAAGPCPAKNTMATPPEGTLPVPCVDYVQSKRDGSGDTHLYLLTDRDIRTGIG